MSLPGKEVTEHPLLLEGKDGVSRWGYNGVFKQVDGARRFLYTYDQSEEAAFRALGGIILEPPYSEPPDNLGPDFPSYTVYGVILPESEGAE